jgi:serine/threonine protein kinase
MADHQRYRVTERIDAGGMAEVFRGVAESLQGFKKNVAIKRILPHLTKNKKFISMFLDEARLSLHLQHANIVAVFDIGQAPPDGANPGAYFIVMEFVEGSNLKGVIDSHRRQGRRVRVAHTLYLMMEVCKGLAYAHDVADETGRPLNIVHRDISPPNILMSRNGEVKLVDFGLAKATSQLEQTDPGVVKGKFSYLSPEAAWGKEVDRRADIFAVGIILYEMLTGKRLFYGETDYQTVELVRQAHVPSMSAQNPEVDAELEAVVRRALARDPEQRFQSAGELQDALAHYLFSHNLKVTSRDIAQLVQETIRERQQSQPVQVAPKKLIDELINEEILKFTSLESTAKPLSPDELQQDHQPGQQPLVDFIDTQKWAEEEPSTEEPIDIESNLADRLKDSTREVSTLQWSMAKGPPNGYVGGAHAAREAGDNPGWKSTAPAERMPEPGETVESRSEASRKKKKGGFGLWIALGALFLIAGGGAVFYLVTNNVIGH